MNDMVLIDFKEEKKEEEVRKRVMEIKSEYIIEMGDDVVVVKDRDGSVKIKKIVNQKDEGDV